MGLLVFQQNMFLSCSLTLIRNLMAYFFYIKHQIYRRHAFGVFEQWAFKALCNGVSCKASGKKGKSGHEMLKRLSLRINFKILRMV